MNPQLADRPEGIIPETDVAVTAPPALGADFAMFENVRDVESYDFSAIDPLPRGFLEAIYFPRNRRTPLAMLISQRSTVGNRTNVTDHGWATARSRHVAERMQSWIVRRREQYARKTLGLRNALALGIAMALFVVIGIGLQSATEAPRRVASKRQASSAPSVRRSESKPEIPAVVPSRSRVDEAGRILEVRASDPRQVLIGYCEASRAAVCDPVELAWSDPPHASLRFGVFRDFYELRAIEIRKDPRTKQWVAGGGEESINDFHASALRLGGRRTPVTSLRASR